MGKGGKVTIGDGGMAEIIALPDDGAASAGPAAWRRSLGGGRLIGQVGWVTGSYAYAQVIRLGTSVVLARLLAPQLFGVMLIVNTLRTGVELLSDIGVGQNIVSNPDGDRPAFFNTAWTLQIVRGFLLAGVALVASPLLASFYADPQLSGVLPLTAVLFVLTGIQSPAHFLLQKRGDVRTYSLFEMAVNTASMVINITLALVTPTIWALIGGLLLSTFISTALSFVLIDPRVYRLRLDGAYTGTILRFGRWVFASSLVFFLAMNFDRLYFARVVPVALLGVYGVARTFTDAGTLLIQRVGNLLIFPKIAASGQDGAALRAAIAGPRSMALRLIAFGLSGAIAGSDRLILTLYDARYHAAAFMLPILMTGVWFAILSALGESVILGTGRPARAASANALKLVWTVVALPVALALFGMAGAIVAIAAAELVRYLALSMAQRAGNLSFLRQDAVLTILLIVLVVMWRLAFTAIGLVPAPAAWWALGVGLHG